MGKKLYITEKPSVASSFASVLGITISRADRNLGYAESKDSVISWCFGHLINMAYPDEYNPAYKQWKMEHLPIIPEQYKYIVIDDAGIKKQFETIKALMLRDDIDEIYSCTDSGREGEYIFRLVYHHSECTKNAKRVWISSHTEESVKEGIKNAKALSEYDSLGKAAYLRAIEDWLFGMNFSRAFTCAYSKKLSKLLGEDKSSVIAIGRVMTCVLGLVVNRENEIQNFVPKTYYEIVGEFLSLESNINYKGKWQQKKKNAGVVPNTENAAPDVSHEEDKYLSKEAADELVEKLKGHTAVVKKVTAKAKNEQSPLLFNLAELQSEANKKFKIPVEKTLEIAQGLYEKKLITYPRTDCRVLSTAIVGELPKILNGIYKNPNFTNYVNKIKSLGNLKITKSTKRYVDDSKVSDHYAIIPTYVSTDIDKLDAAAKNIYILIVKRFLAIFYPPAVYNTVNVETEVNGETFITNAKTLKDAGWKEVYEIFSKKEDEDFTDSPIYNLVKKEKCDVLNFKLEEKQTKPPSRYSDGSLVITMEKAGKFIEDEELRETIKTCGIGTPATRSGIIKKLKDLKYIEINPKTQIISPTKKGAAIVDIVQKTAKELLNPSLTASWEKGLYMIENKETTEDIFLEKLHSYIKKIVNRVKYY